MVPLRSGADRAGAVPDADGARAGVRPLPQDLRPAALAGDVPADLDLEDRPGRELSARSRACRRETTRSRYHPSSRCSGTTSVASRRGRSRRGASGCRCRAGASCGTGRARARTDRSRRRRAGPRPRAGRRRRPGHRAASPVPAPRRRAPAGGHGEAPEQPAMSNSPSRTGAPRRLPRCSLTFAGARSRPAATSSTQGRRR